VKATIKTFLILLIFAILPVILIWLPFYLRVNRFWNIPLPQNGMATVVSNFDGPLYIVAAKTLYNPEEIVKNYQFPLKAEYYSAHYPLYPIFIRVFAYLLGSPYSMLFTTILFSFIAILFFYKHAKLYLNESNALWLTFVFSIFPARWLIVRSIGSPEPLFLASILASTYFFGQKKYLLAGLWGMLAQMTKSPAILLFGAYAIQILIENFKNLSFNGLKKYIPLILAPLGLLIVFGIYKLQYNDFFVYFKSGDNIHLFFPPFQIFNSSEPWVGTFWLEEIIFIYLALILGIYKLYKEKLNTYFYFVLVFSFPLFFVSHRDLLRYALPVVPFLLLGFKDVINKKEFKIAIFVLLIPIYLYSITFISQNTMPISNWSPFL